MPRSRKTTAASNRRPARKQPGTVVDLFAGAGGWEGGAGDTRLRGPRNRYRPVRLRFCSGGRVRASTRRRCPAGPAPVRAGVGTCRLPPFQAYSTAGKRHGRQDKPIVVACAHELAAGNDSRGAWREGCRDARSLLTVEPLRYILALRPRWVALKQVPAVLELWSLFAGLLARHGYQSAAGVLSAECYGVPQTRKRAFLIASLDGPVQLPAPTHCSYDARPRETPACERRLRPWVSVTQALGCDGQGVARTHNQTKGGRRPRGLSRPLLAPAYTLDTASGSWTFHEHQWRFRNRLRQPETRRAPDLPAPRILARGQPGRRFVFASIFPSGFASIFASLVPRRGGGESPHWECDPEHFGFADISTSLGVIL